MVCHQKINSSVEIINQAALTLFCHAPGSLFWLCNFPWLFAVPGPHRCSTRYKRYKMLGQKLVRRIVQQPALKGPGSIWHLQFSKVRLGSPELWRPGVVKLPLRLKTFGTLFCQRFCARKFSSGFALFPKHIGKKNGKTLKILAHQLLSKSINISSKP